MTRNCMNAYLAFVAVFVAYATLASAAYANAELTGEQITHEGDPLHRLTLSSGRALRCAHLTFSGTSEEVTTSLALTPTYAECTLNETFPATVSMEDCAYAFHGGTEAATDEFTEGKMDLVCPEGEGPTVHVFSGETQICKYTVSPYTNKGEVTFENTTGEPGDLDVVTTVTGIAVARVEGSSLNCGGASQTAIHEGATTFEAYTNKAHTSQVDLRIEEE